MKLIGPRVVKAKSGKEWYIYHAVTPKGDEIVQLFVSPEQMSEWGMAKAPAVDPKELEEFLAQFGSVDVQFNSQGRVDSVIVK